MPDNEKSWEDRLFADLPAPGEDSTVAYKAVWGLVSEAVQGAYLGSDDPRDTVNDALDALTEQIGATWNIIRSLEPDPRIRRMEQYLSWVDGDLDRLLKSGKEVTQLKREGVALKAKLERLEKDMDALTSEGVDFSGAKVKIVALTDRLLLELFGVGPESAPKPDSVTARLDNLEAKINEVLRRLGPDL